MKKILLALLFLLLLFSVAYSQTLYNGWISFSSNYLGSNEYEYNFTWGANTTLSAEEIDNLFPEETGPYAGDGWYGRTMTGIGTVDFGLSLSWGNPVDIIFMTYRGDVSGMGMTNRTFLDLDDILTYWWSNRDWIKNTEFSFRTKGNTRTQNLGVNIDYYADYVLLSGTDRPYLAFTAGTPLRVTGSFDPIPEPSTLLLLGSGFLGLAGFARYKLRKKR